MHITTTLAALPVPDAIAAAHSARLSAVLRTAIAEQDGQISFARFMELALYAPGLGYYAAGSQKLGPAGDFITAPEISPLFARCLARQIEQVLRKLGQGDILEVGAGSGILACDILRELAARDCLPDHYFILELSADLRERQQRLLAEQLPQLLARIVWLDSLPPPGWRGVVLANELLDAMPVHRFRIAPDGARELYVGVQDDEFVWCESSGLSDVALVRYIDTIQQELHTECGESLESGFESEINLNAVRWVSSIAGFLAAGLLLIIDYGYPRREYYHPQRAGGTLLCHYRHRAQPDPFFLPGLQDITAHVDFTAVAEAADSAGLRVAGYTTQAAFLLGCGLIDLAQDETGVSTRQRLDRARQIKTLTLPAEMGELFKAIALTRGLDEPLLGFQLYDMRDRL